MKFLKHEIAPGRRAPATHRRILPGLGLIGAIGLAGLAGCTLEDNALDKNYTCDAHATLLELCMQEPASPDALDDSKNTCKSVHGTWTENGSCPSGSVKKCPDGTHQNFYYAADDAKKSCGDLIGALLSDRVASSAMAKPASLEPRRNALPRCLEGDPLQALMALR